MSDPSSPGPKSFLPRLGHWAAQVLLVFLGAYAAFWLNNYQEHQQEARRVSGHSGLPPITVLPMTDPETVLGIPHRLADVREFFDDLEKAHSELLMQIRAKRQRH
jgi:uracil-DNA glycosylase